MTTCAAGSCAILGWCRLFSSEETVWYLDNLPKYLDGLDPTASHVMVPRSNLMAPGESDTYQCEHGCGDKVRAFSVLLCSATQGSTGIIEVHQGEHCCGNQVRHVVSCCVPSCRPFQAWGRDLHPCESCLAVSYPWM